MKPQEQKALAALQYILPLLQKYGFTWIITGGFACYVYGVDRPITDIDIDIEINKDDARFITFLKETAAHAVAPIEHNQDGFYDNWSYELIYGGQIIDICPSQNILIKNKQTGVHERFYDERLPSPELVEWNGVTLPLLPKPLVIKNKKMIMRDEFDERDIKSLQDIIDQKSA